MGADGPGLFVETKRADIWVGIKHRQGYRAGVSRQTDVELLTTRKTINQIPAKDTEIITKGPTIRRW